MSRHRQILDEVDAVEDVLRDAAGGETLIRLSAPERGRTFCVVASLRPAADGVVITKEERYFSGHEEADRAYRFGFRWSADSK